MRNGALITVFCLINGITEEMKSAAEHTIDEKNDVDEKKEE